MTTAKGGGFLRSIIKKEVEYGRMYSTSPRKLIPYNSSLNLPPFS
jgi:hypothetical protein